MYVRTFRRSLTAICMTAALAACSSASTEEVEQEYLGRLNDIHGPSDAADQQTLLEQGRFSCDFETAPEFYEATPIAYSRVEANQIFELARSTGLCDTDPQD
jgi:hypothetical protein